MTNSELQLEVEPTTHDGAITTLATCTDGRTYCTLGTDQRLRIWRLGQDRPHRTLRGPGSDPERPLSSGSGRIDALTLHPSGDWMAVAVSADDSSGGRKASIWLYDIEADSIDPIDWPETIVALATSADGMALAVADERHVSLLRLTEQDEQEVISTPLPGAIASFAVTHNDNYDARLVVTTVESGAPHVFDVIGDAFAPVEFDVPVERRGLDLSLVIASSEGLVFFGPDGVDICDANGDHRQTLGVVGTPTAAAWSPNLTELMVAAVDGGETIVTTFALMDRDDENVPAVIARRVVPGTGYVIGVIDWSAGVIAGGHPVTLRTFDLHSGDADEHDHLLRPHAAPITAIGIAGDIVALFRTSDETNRSSAANAPAWQPPTSSVSEVERLFDLSDINANIDGASDLAEADDSNATEQTTAPPFVEFARGRSEIGGRRFETVNGELGVRDDATGGRVPLAVRPITVGFIDAHHVFVGDVGGVQHLVTIDASMQITDRRRLTGCGEVVDVAANDRWMVTADVTGAVQLWRLDDLLRDDRVTTEPITPTLHLFMADDGEWALWTSGGFYTASPGGDCLLSFRHDHGDELPQQSFHADRFAERRRRPAVIEQVVHHGSEQQALTDLGIERTALKTGLPPVVRDLHINDITETDATVRFEVANIGGPPATRFAVLVNGIPFWESEAGEPVEGGHELEVWLDDGRNVIRVVAENDVGRSTPVDREIDSTMPEAVVAASASEIDYVESVVEVPVEHAQAEYPAAEVAHAQVSMPTAFLAGATTSVDVDVDAYDHTTVRVETQLGEMWKAECAPGTSVALSISTPLSGDDHLTVTSAVGGIEQTIYSMQATTSNGAGFGLPLDIATIDETEDEDTPPPVNAPPNTAGGNDAGLGARGTGSESMSNLSAPNPAINESAQNHSAHTDSARNDLTNATNDAGESAVTTRRTRPNRSMPPTREDPHLFMVCVGVSDIDRDGGALGDLKYAADDAMEIANRFSTARSNAFAHVWRRVLVDHNATSDAITSALDELAAAVAARTADKRARNVRANDVVMFFFAGHGITRRSSGDTGDQFYAVSHDYDEQRVDDSCVSIASIGKVLSALPMQVMVLIDACRSGAALPDRWRRTNPNELSRELITNTDRVMYVISATTSTETAWEHTMLVPYLRTGQPRARVGHGFFTHAILKRVDEAGPSLSLMELVAGIQRQLVEWTDRPGWRHVRQRPKAQIDGEIPHLEIYRSLSAP